MKHPLAALFDQFLKERIYLKNVTPKTIIWYQVAFKAYGRALPREALALPTKAVLQQFVIGLRDRGLRPVTCNTYIGAMNAFCGWLHQEGHIGGPLKLKKLQAEKRFVMVLDEAQMKQLVSFKPKTFTQWRVHIAACLMLDTGLRLSEALNLKQDAVDLNNLLLRVFGKGQKERLVPFSVELRKRLFRYEQFKIKKGLRHRLLFATFRGTRWEARNSTTSLHLLLRKIGVRAICTDILHSPARVLVIQAARAATGERR
jgi:integrase/recombinase XerD